MQIHLMKLIFHLLEPLGPPVAFLLQPQQLVFVSLRWMLLLCIHQESLLCETLRMYTCTANLLLVRLLRLPKPQQSPSLMTTMWTSSEERVKNQNVGEGGEGVPEAHLGEDEEVEGVGVGVVDEARIVGGQVHTQMGMREMRSFTRD
mmetsp:Transcript_28599/g.54672  ORF Transcript_28599/g.54672 Transcript_28599/m.54672 type:complete len:147 (-) Transcript_28599:645-1085(-)